MLKDVGSVLMGGSAVTGFEFANLQAGEHVLVKAVMSSSKSEIQRTTNLSDYRRNVHNMRKL